MSRKEVSRPTGPPPKPVAGIGSAGASPIEQRPQAAIRELLSRVATLESRLALTEARIASLEAGVTTTITTPGPAISPNNAQLGKDARCGYCGGSLWVCRGSHVVC